MVRAAVGTIIVRLDAVMLLLGKNATLHNNTVGRSEGICGGMLLFYYSIKA